MCLNRVKNFLIAAVLLMIDRTAWTNAMLERIQSDAGVPKSNAANSANRADLAVTPTPPTTDLRDKAIAPVGQAQRSSTEADIVNAPALAIRQVQGEFEVIQRTEADQKALEKLYEKILPGYKALKDKIDDPALVHDAVVASEQVAAFGSRRSGSDGNVAPPVMQFPSDKERTLAKIDDALLKVGSLRSKLSSDNSAAHDNLLNINASESGLDMARMQVNDDSVMTASASIVCDAIMSNVRGAVAAHGGVSANLVRLILN